MNKFYRYMRAGIAVTVGLLTLLAFAGIFYPLKIFDTQFAALLQRVLVDFSTAAVILLLLLLAATFLFGRFYCSTLCPLGLFQELLTLIFHRKNKVQPHCPYKYFLAALVFGALAGGTAYLVRLIDPYALFGSAISGAWLGMLLLGLLTILVWFKGRLFCAQICPVGTVLGLISRYSVFKIYLEKDKCVSCGLCASKCPTGSIDFKNKTINNETCIRCFRCLSGCKRSGVHYGTAISEEIKFSPSRRRLLFSGTVVAVFALAAKGGIDFSKAVAAKFKKVILPAGARNAGDFANRCLNCNLCVQNCPMKILKKANEDYPAVHIDYSESFCDYNCHKCSQVCPSGALSRLSLEEKQKTQIGMAVIDTKKCIKCGLCAMKCPRQAIAKESGEFPIVDPDICIGCGVCQNACPVKVITIAAVDRQKTL